MDQNKKIFYPIVIIGAGPAGLCCAYELVKNDLGPILVLEKGVDIFERNHKNFLHHFTEGVGGPGLYGDAKLCVYGGAGTKLTEFYEENQLNKLAGYVDRIFCRFGAKNIKKRIPTKNKTEKLQKMCKTFGLQLKMAYPVRHLGVERGKGVVKNLSEWLRLNNCVITTQVMAKKIIKSQNGFKIITKNKYKKEKIINCKYLICAVGRSGNFWLKEQCKKLQIPFSLNIPDIGIRIECSKNVLKPIYNLVKNPRIELATKMGYIKTHCLCLGGEIIVYSLHGMLLVDGQTNHTGDNAHINLLYHSEENKDFFNNLKVKKPIIQRMGNFLLRKITSRKDLEKNKLTPNAPLNLFERKDINKVFPKEICSHLKNFIFSFDKLCPGFIETNNLVYAPVIEWNTYRIKVNKEMETKLKNFYVIGDGSGLTQGIIAAGVTGILAARSIISKKRASK
ncbi:MAG: NAD(P)-binding protein [Candidatus Pacearchaeota archaeon]